MVTTVALTAVGERQLTSTSSVVPAFLAVVARFDLLSVYLLMGEYRDNGDRRLLAMCGAYVMLFYVWSFLSRAARIEGAPSTTSAIQIMQRVRSSASGRPNVDRPQPTHRRRGERAALRLSGGLLGASLNGAWDGHQPTARCGN